MATRSVGAAKVDAEEEALDPANAGPLPSPREPILSRRRTGEGCDMPCLWQRGSDYDPTQRVPRRNNHG